MHTFINERPHVMYYDCKSVVHGGKVPPREAVTNIYGTTEGLNTTYIYIVYLTFSNPLFTGNESCMLAVATQKSFDVTICPWRSHTCIWLSTDALHTSTQTGCHPHNSLLITF